MTLLRGAYCFILGCALGSAGCASGPDGTPSDTSGTLVDTCQNKPYFDTLSASDHKTIVKGMTDGEREACYRFGSPSSGGGGGM